VASPGHDREAIAMNPRYPHVLLAPNVRLTRQIEPFQEEMIGLLCDARLMAHCGGPMTPEDAQERLKTDEPAILWAIQRRNDQRVVGLASLAQHRVPELILDSDCWGQGYATETFWLLTMELPELIGNRLHLPKGNPASRRVAERCGYRLLGTHDDHLELEARADRAVRLNTLSAFYTAQAAERVKRLHREIGIAPGYAVLRNLTAKPEARVLVQVGLDQFDRPLYIDPRTAGAWEQMRDAAQADGITLIPVSGFRDIHYQADLIRRKMDGGESLANILDVSAAPGFSEHHLGVALDLNTPGCPALETDFENTDAFEWLGRRGADFGFRMSYPEDNAFGFLYEPWHWAFRPSEKPARPV
jgi:D-alanyl-D-alanine carboxypeptidase